MTITPLERVHEIISAERARLGHGCISDPFFDEERHTVCFYHYAPAPIGSANKWEDEPEILEEFSLEGRLARFKILSPGHSWSKWEPW